jgi:hypothetical protein
VTAELVRTGVVTVCCGGHRPAAGCLCCLECPAGAATSDPELLALLASGLRAHRAALRMALRRAEYALDLAPYWDLYRATARAARPFRALPSERLHFEGSLT